MRNNFNVSIAEKPSDKWQICDFSFTCVNYSRAGVTSTINSIEDFIRSNSDVYVLETEKEVF